MDNRVLESGASTTPPVVPSSPSVGYPTKGNPSTGTPSSKGGVFWHYQIGEEIRAVQVAAGITPSTADLTQLLQALNARYAQAGQINSADNPILNGEHLVDQTLVGAAVAVAIGATGTTQTYLDDGHYGWSVGAAAQYQVIAGAGEFAKYGQFTGAASVSQIGKGTRIHSADAARFTNQTVTAIVRMANSLVAGQAITWTAYYANVKDVWAAGAKTQIATGTLNITNALAQYSFSFSFAAGANAGNGLCIEYTVGAQTSGTWQITGEDLVIGSIARPYPHRAFGDVLAKCQDFYEKSYEYSVAPGTGTVTDREAQNGIAINANSLAAISTTKYKRTKRIAPTVTFYRTPTGASGQCDVYGNGVITNVSCSTQAAGINGFEMNPGALGTAVASWPYQITAHWVADARL